MSYTLYKTNGTFLATIADGSLDTTTDLVFVGKNYSGYGTIVNQDLVKLLENFAGKIQPAKSLTGQLWYDTANARLKVNTGGYYKPVANIESSNTAPSNAVKADLWYDESVKKLKFFDGNSYVVIGPQISGASANTIVEYSSISSDTGTDYNILVHKVQAPTGDQVTVAITSQEEFTVGTGESLKSSFYQVKKGITLANTHNTTGVGDGAFILWGDSSNSLKVGGKTIEEIVLRASPSVSGQLVSSTDLGLEINSTTRLRNVSNDTVLANLHSGSAVSIQANIGGGLVELLRAGQDANGNPAILPINNAAYAPANIGDTSQYGRFGNVYVKNVNSLGTMSVTGNATFGSNVTVTSTATVKTLMPSADSQADIGTASARFGTIRALSVYADNGFHGPLLGGTAYPLTANSTGKLGEVAFDSGYVYICIATNTWKRAPLTTW